MLVLSCDIMIGNLVLNSAASVDIKSDWRELTDTCVIKIAKNINVKGADLSIKNIADVIKTGQRVVVKLGYDGLNNTRFVGYVARSPLPTMPLEIQCEDEMWTLKRKPIKTKTFANSKVSDLIKYIAPEYASDVLDSELGRNYVVRTGTACGALLDLEKTFGLKSFFRLVEDKPVLIVGKPYGSSDLLTSDPILYDFQKNVKRNSLQYKTADDIRVRVRAICKIPNAKDLVVEVGDSDGALRTMHYINVSEAALRKNAEADLNQLKADGYQGDIVGFGIPANVRHGKIASITDSLYEQRNAVKYHIDAVNDNWGQSGYEVTATIGWKVSGNTFKREK